MMLLDKAARTPLAVKVQCIKPLPWASLLFVPKILHSRACRRTFGTTRKLAFSKTSFKCAPPALLPAAASSLLRTVRPQVPCPTPSQAVSSSGSCATTPRTM